jgi:hypothetical protein
MEQKDKGQLKVQKAGRRNFRDWENSEWFRKWLKIIRDRTPQRAAAC